MKKYASILYCLILIAGGFNSCTIESIHNPGEQGLPVNIAIVTGARADNDPSVTGIHYGDDIDSKIEKLRVLGYSSGSGLLAFNKVIDINAMSSKPGEGEIYTVIEILTGTYDFVFIANEDSDDFMPYFLSGSVPELNVLSILKEDLSFTYDAFASDKAIPMCTFIENVQVINDHSLNVDGTPVSGTWKVPMERLAIRVELEIEMPSDYLTNGVLYIKNLPYSVYLIQQENTELSFVTEWESRNEGWTGTNSWNVLSDDGTTAVVKWNRLILPECWFNQKNDALQAVELILDPVHQTRSANGVKSALIGLDIPDDYTLPRNHYFKINGTVSEELEIEYTIMEWETFKNDVDYDPTIYRLDVSETYLDMGNTASATDAVVQVTTTHPDGWSAYFSAYPDRIDLTGVIWMNDAYLYTGELDNSAWYGHEGLPAEKTLNLYITVENPGAGLHTGYLHIISGNMTNVITLKKSGLGGN